MAGERLSNRDVARALLELADLLDLSADRTERYRARSIRRGGQAIERLAEPAVELGRRRLRELPEIGDGIARRVEELTQRGRLAELDEVRARHAGLLAVARVDGIGPTTTRRLHARLGVIDLDSFAAVAVSGRLREIPGLGARKVDDLLRAIEHARAPVVRRRRDVALREAAPLIEAARAAPGVTRVDLVGSLRRGREVVGDIDLLAETEDPTAVAEAFTRHRHVEIVLAHGARSSVRTYAGLQVDLWTARPEEYGLALHHYTGGRDHNIELRNLALERGLKITEHGIYELAGAGPRRPGGREEREVYDALGLPWIPLEMREHRGEIARALRGPLPRLLEAADLRGDLHVHWGGELDALNAIARVAAAAGRSYVAITDRVGEGGVDPATARMRARAVRAAGEREGVRLLAGAEVEILPDGTLAAPSALLGALDWVLGAIHTHPDLPRARQTARLVRAIESGLVDAIAHPTGRRLVGGVELPGAGGQASAPGCLDLDLDEVIAAAARTDVALELNAHPERLDPTDVVCFAARERGAWVVLSSGALEPAAVGDVALGVLIARRAWLEPQHVLNTRPARDLLDLLAARRREAGLVD